MNDLSFNETALVHMDDQDFVKDQVLKKVHHHPAKSSVWPAPQPDTGLIQCQVGNQVSQEP